ncbi:TlpA family protein disulfide reductase [Paenibacillus sp. IB182496]|uniref:TlpA family protein disulfide reductase n=1 Tax=Paenibacillus sabuli TaxID=2772509 RepID=A0A927BQC6_9BACL|nr:TlpA disulfide reductase family protein [Paenibacillus sabuli]MBD2844798.1 TlpA family protein disulfide reductase [Paenibacillus sabuli]
MKRNWIILGLLVLVSGYILYDQLIASDADGTVVSAPVVGSLVPDFELPDLGDRPVEVGGETGKLTLINFWASWCQPCYNEAPDLQQLHAQYGDRVQVIGVNATSLDKERYAREFVDELNLTYTILMDREGEVTKLYNINAYPLNLLVDRQGIVREQGAEIDFETAERWVRTWSDAAEEDGDL